MSQWHCFHCDRDVDSNDQDHANYDIMMCEDCVDREMMTPKQNKDYCAALIEAAIIAKELNEQHEKQMQGWMNDLDQDDQAIEDFCRD